jgi:hypothetical protein
MVNPNDINFYGNDWRILEMWLAESKEKKVGLLINEPTHDKSNRLRGSLDMINELLRLKNAANGPQSQG